MIVLLRSLCPQQRAHLRFVFVPTMLGDIAVIECSCGAYELRLGGSLVPKGPALCAGVAKKQNLRPLGKGRLCHRS